MKSLDYILAVLALMAAFVIKPSDLNDALLGFSNYVGGICGCSLFIQEF
ncbi:hypothetical protein [Thermococcus sp. JCM 11816]